jgi:hypothetical protein
VSARVALKIPRCACGRPATACDHCLHAAELRAASRGFVPAPDDGSCAVVEAPKGARDEAVLAYLDAHPLAVELVELLAGLDGAGLRAPYDDRGLGYLLGIVRGRT